MIEMRARIAGPFASLNPIPATVADPELGEISVPSVLTVVVLPAPFGPRKPNTSPYATSNETSSKATRSPKRLLRRSTVRACSPGAGVNEPAVGLDRCSGLPVAPCAELTP